MIVKNLLNGLHDMVFRLKHAGEDLWCVSSDDDHLTLLKNGRVLKTVRWDDITEINAEKRDAITTEKLFVVFHASGCDFAIEELYDGFQSLMKEVQNRFRTIQSDWYAELNKGEVFKNKHVTLWTAAKR